MKIAGIEFPEKPIFLAPMEDITDPSFRFMCKKFGADMMYTEFVSSDGLIRDAKKTVQKLNVYEYEHPVGIQIYGHIPDAMQQAAEIVNLSHADILDINFGCPMKKIAGRGAGSGLLRDLPLMKLITDRIIKVSKLPVTAKTRLGWDNENLNIEEVVLMLQDIGIQAITIHGRTRAQMYKGDADWTLIGKIKNNPNIKIPIIGNGDVTSAQIAANNFEKYGVDAIMVGRAAIGRPWIFEEIKYFIKTGEELAPPTVAQRVEYAKEHLQKSIEFKEGQRAIYEMRRHLNLYFKSIPNFKETRLKLLTANSNDEIINTLDYILEKFS
jgi:nifR3 family TIM-barrel protein